MTVSYGTVVSIRMDRLSTLTKAARYTGWWNFILENTKQNTLIISVRMVHKMYWFKYIDYICDNDTECIESNTLIIYVTMTQNVLNQIHWLYMWQWHRLYWIKYHDYICDNDTECTESNKLSFNSLLSRTVTCLVWTHYWRSRETYI